MIPLKTYYTLMMYLQIFIGVMIVMYLAGSFIAWDLTWVAKEGFGQIAKFAMLSTGLCVTAMISVLLEMDQREPE